MDEQMISDIASALQNADLHDGDEGNHYRLFDLLDFSGENKSVMITRQLATAAHSVIAGKVAERREVDDLCAKVEADAVSGLRYIEARYGRLEGVGWDRVFDAHDELFRKSAALAPYPERR